MKNRKMKRIALISTILAVLLLITGCSFASPNQNNPIPENVDFSGEVQVADQDALRKALKAKNDCTIILSGDIVITEELTVNGNKKLSGGSIIMDRRRVGSNESVLAISKGAYLVLDGTTVDGNGVADCVTVKAGGCFESESGSLIYGYPYGLDVSGTVKINDILIDEALHTAVNVAIFGEVDMLGGTISNNVYGISVAEDACMDIADGVVMDNSYGSYIINYGDMDIAGGKYNGSNENAIENYGKMSIKGTEENPIEISGGKKSALNSKNKSTLTAENIRILNMGWHGMCVEKGSTATLKNIHLENAVKSTLYINSSKVKMENVSVIGGKLYAIYATQNAEVEMHNITVKDTMDRGIYNERSNVTIDGLYVENTAKNGFYSAGDSAVTHISNAEFYNVGASAIGVAKGKVTATSIYVSGTKKEGLSVAATGTLTVECSTIMNNGNFAIANYGGKVTAKNVNMYNTLNVSVKLMDGCTFKGEGLNIVNSYKQAISVEGGSTANVTKSNISGTKMAGINVDNSYLKMTDSVIKNAGSYGIAAQKKGKAILDDIEIYDAGTRGIGALNSYVVAANIKVYNPGGVGMYTEGAESQLNMANIEIYNAGTCGFGFKGGKEITARNVLIDTTKNEGIYAFNAANVKKLDNITIKNPGGHGISVEGDATVNVVVDSSFNPDNKTGNGVTILNGGSNGIRVKGGTLNAAGVTIDGSKTRGVFGEENANITLKNATIKNAGTKGIEFKGTEINISGLTVNTTGLKTTNTADAQGVHILSGAKATIENISVQGTKGIALRVAGSANVTVNGGTINGNTYGVYADGTSQAVLTDVNVEKTGTSSEPLVYIKGTAKVELAGSTKIDGKNAGVVGVNVADSRAAFTLNGATFIDNANDVVLAKDACIGLKSALTDTLTVKPAAYESGTQIVTDAGVGEAGLKNSTKKIDVGSETCYVGEDGKLVATVAVMNGVSYGSLLDAVADANKTAEADTIKLLCDVTVTDQLKPTTDITITADKGVVIQVSDSVTGSVFYVTDGKLNITGASESEKITVKASKKSQSLVKNDGGTVVLTNMHLAGHTGSTRTDGTVFGIYNNKGTVSAKNVVITDMVPKNCDGIYTKAGTTTNLDNVTIENCGRYGLKTYGTVNIYNTANASNALSISNTYDHGIDIDNGGKVISTLNNVPNGTYAIKIDTTTKANNARGILVRGGGEVKLSHISIKNTAFYGVDFLAANSVGTISNFEIAGTASHGVNVVGTATLTDGSINSNTYGINATSSGLTLGGVAVSGTPAGLKLASGKFITVNGALNSAITLEPASYAQGTVVAEKGSGISDDDFKASMAKLQPVDTTWVVDENGKLAYASHAHDYVGVVTKNATCTEAGEKTYTCSICSDSYIDPISALGHTVVRVAANIPTLETEGNIEHWYCSVCNTYWKDAENKNVIAKEDVTLPVVAAGNVAYMNGTAYASLNEAVSNAGAGDTIHLLANATVTSQIKPAVSLTIKAAQPVTITANVAQAFYVESGKTLTMECSSGKITVTSTLKSSGQEVFYNVGTLNLTNVAISGGVSGINTRSGAVSTLSNVTVEKSGNDGLVIGNGGTMNLSDVTVSDATGHGINCAGTLKIVKNVTIDGAGIYVQETGSLTGSGLTVQNARSKAINLDDTKTSNAQVPTLNLSNLKILDAGAQAIQANTGTVTISGFEISGTGSAALRPINNNAKFYVSNGTVTTKSYGCYASHSTEVVLTDVTFVRNGTSTNAVVYTDGSAKLTATNVTVKTTDTDNALSIKGEKIYEGITVVTAE